MPPHILPLKLGVPIIFHRNINSPRLCNGYRFSVKEMMNNVYVVVALTSQASRCDATNETQPMYWPSSAKTRKEKEFGLHYGLPWTMLSKQQFRQFLIFKGGGVFISCIQILIQTLAIQTTKHKNNHCKCLD